MTERQSVMQKKQSSLFFNLLALGFHPQSLEMKHRCHFSENMFDKPNNRAFEVVIHFLFGKLNPKQTDELFRTCFPSTDKKTNQQFRKVCYNWLKRISEQYPDFGIPKATTTLLMSPGGKDFVNLMFLFSGFVLHKLTTDVCPYGILRPPQLCKNLARAQINTIRAMNIKEFNEHQKQVQIIKKTDEELQKLADEQMKEYHAFQKKKKFLLQKKQRLEGETRIYSEAKQKEIQRQRKKDLDTGVKKIRSKWNEITNMVEKCSAQREIFTSVLCEEKDKLVLDGNALQPKVPAKLLNDCQEEIYQTIGTSLYEGGLLNLTSLVSLNNLALTLVADTLHEVGPFDFTKYSSFLKVQIKRQEDDMVKLFDIKRTVEGETADVKSSIKCLKEDLDKIYRDRHQADNNHTLSEDFTLAEFDVTSNIPLPDAKDKTVFEDCLDNLNDSPKGIAERCLLPEERKLEDFLEEIVSSSFSSASSVQHPSTSEAWTIPVNENKPGSLIKKVSSPGTQSNRADKLKPALTQGKPKHVAFEDRLSAGLIQHSMLSRTPDGTKRVTGARDQKKKTKGRKSMSLPSSPLVQRGENIKLTPFRSSTPDAEQKLINEIVNCTLQPTDSERSPLVVYEKDNFCQLDRSAFVSRDKIMRTPPIETSTCPETVGLDDTDEPSTSAPPTFMNVSSSQSPHAACSLDKETALKGGLTSYEGLANITRFPEQYQQGTSQNGDVICGINSLDKSIQRQAKDHFDVSADIDYAWDTMLENTLPHILDTSALDDLEESDFDDNETKIDVTTTLVAVDAETTDVNSNIAYSQSKDVNAIDLLMASPVSTQTTDYSKENDLLQPTVNPFSSPLVKVPTSSLAFTPDRPTLQEFELNLLPTSELAGDIQTPEFQRFKSLLNYKSAKK
ncbi:unnamed protein product [Clavelina lepadiformis]|uniref:HAUS augmin-like complex subunit 6 N-terminal domain-containing protein n=1 Tax=Clavelina lepadiformis TaxID=159417 RepID=A0ABP0FGN4_CLALP